MADIPDMYAAAEVDLHGMRADEIEHPILRAIDNAILGDFPALRIIHGKGSGALRRRVAEILKKDSRVTRFRIGYFHEGGDGVTVAELE